MLFRTNVKNKSCGNLSWLFNDDLSDGVGDNSKEKLLLKIWTPGFYCIFQIYLGA